MAHERQYIRDMTPLILVSVLIPIVIVIVVVIPMIRKAGSLSGGKLLQTGAPGTAQIIGVQQGSMVVNMTNYECHISARITLPGEAPYDTTFSQLIPMVAMPRIQPGAVVAVKVDMADRSKAVIDFNAPVA